MIKRDRVKAKTQEGSKRGIRRRGKVVKRRIRPGRAVRKGKRSAKIVMIGGEVMKKGSKVILRVNTLMIKDRKVAIKTNKIVNKRVLTNKGITPQNIERVTKRSSMSTNKNLKFKAGAKVALVKARAEKTL
jgi:hypothetical protein